MTTSIANSLGSKTFAWEEVQEYYTAYASNPVALVQTIGERTSQRRTKVDFAQCMKVLVGVHFPYAEEIRVVLDNLKTHTPAAWYEAFEPTEARRVLRKLDFHFTPKHSSWLNMAEIEISILSRQCLKRRIGSLAQLVVVSQQWTQARNTQQVQIDWCFDLRQARAKLACLYP